MWKSSKASRQRTHLSIWLVILDGEVGRGSSCCKLGSSRVRTLLAPAIRIDSTLESDQRDLHDGLSGVFSSPSSVTFLFLGAGVQVARCPSQMQELICRGQVAEEGFGGEASLECNTNSIQKSFAPALS